ncbi:Short-chain dehydrogenase/reductase SDR [Corchorus olitorius]|uniref:Short-chain dehydrogenase/reductase SDR n=1 Tax=Corchorus olitorius TaxID=93759 RepID=A0A1R3JDJ7_9ROSI|nr:Short-chain dehydrogenase/reductase SDR [Corchorus olitorius]
MTSLTKKTLSGKVAIITGGARGIGEATARLFADHGARTIIVADIQDELGQQVATSIATPDCICTYVHCDVSDEDQVKSLVESTVQNHGKLDIMFSNAGILSKSDQTILDLDFAQFDRLMAINVRGMVTCVKEAARVMVEGCVRGSIICTGSMAASNGTKKWIDYCVSKHAVLGLVRSASKQLGVHGIRVNCVSPAGVATPMTCDALDKGVVEVEEFFGAKRILKGVALRARHVADAVLFLASDGAELITGQDLLVDGGFQA